MEVSNTMTVLFALVKILAVLVCVLIAIVITALLLPLGFAVEYRPNRLRVVAVYGPLRRTIWSHRLHKRAIFSKPDRHDNKSESRPQPAPFRKEAEEISEPAPEQETKLTELVKPDSPPEAAVQPLPAEPVQEEDEEMESGAVLGRLERMIELAAEDPKALGNCVLQHMRWLQRHSIFKVHISHLNIFWTVTGDDAAETAIAYGAEMAAFNMLLALAQQMILLQSDCLWLEPDFTGTRHSERRISGTVSARAILMFHLLYRIWKDPLLQPATTKGKTA